MVYSTWRMAARVLPLNDADQYLLVATGPANLLEVWHVVGQQLPTFQFVIPFTRGSFAGRLSTIEPDH